MQKFITRKKIFYPEKYETHDKTFNQIAKILRYISSNKNSNKYFILLKFLTSID